MIWIILLSAFAWSMIKCEPPPNSYLPPATGPVGSPSSEYGAPGTGNRTPGRQNSPGGRGSSAGDSYLPPSSANPQNTIKPEYGPPTQGGSLGSQRGGVPPRGSNQQRPGQLNEPQCGGSNGPCNQPSSQYGAPGGNNGHGLSGRPGQSTFGNNGNRPSGNGLQSSYGPPNRGQGSSSSDPFGGSDIPQSPDTSYGTPNTGFPSQGSGFPGQSQRPGAPNSQRGLLRDSPSSTYGAPNAGNAPGGRTSGYQPSGGDDSDEPAKYEFNYDVDDSQTGTKFGHSEQRDGDLATGEYNVVLPDGRKQVVEYEAGLDGYKPQIRYEGGGGGAGFGFGFGGGAGRGGGGGGGGGAGSGYPSGRPGSDSLGGGYPQNSQGPQVGKYQQPNDFNQDQDSGYPSGSSQEGGYPSASAGGFPRGKPQGGNGNYKNGGDIGSQRGGYPSGQEGDGGYPRGGPGGDHGSPGGQGRNGKYSSGGPQGSNGYPGSQNGRNGQNRGRGGSGGDENGYPSGGPDGPRGSGY